MSKTAFSLSLSCAMGLGLCVASTQAADETDELLTMDVADLLQVRVVEIATGVKQTTDKAPAVTTVITAADIEEMGARSLDDIMETVPGLHVTRNSTGYNPIYTIRGIHSQNNSQVLILVDGSPINTLQTGGRSLTWSGVALSTIARIEVMRGPGSAVYGADAFSGVINIITKEKADIDASEIGLRVGQFNTQGAWLAHGAEWGGVDAAVMLEYQSSDGADLNIEQDLQSFYDRISGTQASQAPGSANLSRKNLEARLSLSKDNWRLRLAYQGGRDGGNGVGTNQALDPNGRFKSDTLSADVNYQNKDFAENWEVSGQLSFINNIYDVEENNTLLPPGVKLPPGPAGFVYPIGYILNPGVSERNTRLNLSSFYKGLDKHLIRIGGGIHYGEIYDVRHVSNVGVNPSTGLPIFPTDLVDLSGTPQAFLSTGQRTNYNLFIQDAWTLADKWELTSGVRYDHYSDFGSTLNPRIALVWETSNTLTSKLLYGRAFRAPSFADLYNVNNPTALGNPDLKPETIQTLELAFDYRPDNLLSFNLSFYTYRWRDAIRYVADEGRPTFTAQNIGSQDGHGIELEAKWQLNSDFHVLANYSYQRSTDNDNDHDAGYAPQHQVYMRSDWRFLDNWHLNSQLNWVTGRERVFNDPRETVDDYLLVDLTLRYKGFKGQWDFAAGVRNLFDTDAYEPTRGPDQNGIIGIPGDLPLPGRHYFAELRYYF